MAHKFKNFRRFLQQAQTPNSAESEPQPNLLNPQNFRDLIRQKMAVPDSIERAIVADKIAVRGWIAERIGRDHLIPLMDICKTADELRPNAYPLPVVVKPNHTSGPLRFVRDESDWEGLEGEAAKWLATDTKSETEWVYRNILRCLMVERMLVDDNENPVPDIRVHCMFGEPVMITYSRDTPTGRQPYFFDPDWKQLDIEHSGKNQTPPPEPPETLGKMMEIAGKLSSAFDYIRVDLYPFEGSVYCGELTNFTLAGQRIYSPYSFDVWLLKEFYRRRDARIANERARFHLAETRDKKT